LPFTAFPFVGAAFLAGFTCFLAIVSLRALRPGER
jgi:hypothetical protein